MDLWGDNGNCKLYKHPPKVLIKNEGTFGKITVMVHYKETSPKALIKGVGLSG